MRGYGVRGSDFGVKLGLGSHPKLWGMGEYGILEVWVMRESTVVQNLIHSSASE